MCQSLKNILSRFPSKCSASTRSRSSLLLIASTMGAPLLSIKFNARFSPSFCTLIDLFVAKLVGYSLVDFVSVESVSCKFGSFIDSFLAKMCYFSVERAEEGLSCLTPSTNISAVLIKIEFIPNYQFSRLF